MSAAKRLNPMGSEELLQNYLNLGHLIQLQFENPHFNSDEELVKTIQNSMPQLYSDPLFLLQGLKNISHWELGGAADKKPALDELRNYLKDSVNQSLLEDSLSCVDELVTNAIFNAPFSTPVDRKTLNVTLPPGKKVVLGVGQTESELFISCTDPFGSLNVHSFFNRILSCHIKGVGDSINYGEGGAGIGSFMVFEQASSIMVGVKPNHRTIIGCKFPKTIGSKKRKVSPKNLIIFIEEE